MTLLLLFYNRVLCLQRLHGGLIYDEPVLLGAVSLSSTTTVDKLSNVTQRARARKLSAINKDKCKS